MPTSTRKKTPVLWWFSGEYVKLWFHVVGADDPVRRRKCAFLRKSDAKSQYFEGTMWASAPTNNHENSTNFEGGQGRPPLQMRVKNVQVRRKNAVLPVLCRGFYFPTQKRSKILFVISSRMVRPVTSPRADMAASTSTSTASGVMPCRMDSSAASSAFPARRTASA